MRRHELATDQIRRTTDVTRLRCRDPRAPAHLAGQTHRPHQALARAVRRADPVAPKLLPDVAGPLQLVVLVVDALNLDAQRVIALRSCRAPRRIGVALSVAVIRRRGDRQDAADQLDPDRSRWASMYDTIGATCSGGRAPPGRGQIDVAPLDRHHHSASRPYLPPTSILDGLECAGAIAASNSNEGACD